MFIFYNIIIFFPSVRHVLCDLSPTEKHNPPTMSGNDIQPPSVNANEIPETREWLASLPRRERLIMVCCTLRGEIETICHRLYTLEHDSDEYRRVDAELEVLRDSLHHKEWEITQLS